MRFYFISALFIFVLISCRKIDKKDLKVIDNIQLGLSYDSFIKQLDSLGIKKSPCFRSMTSLNIIEDTDIISGKACLIYYTENLNYGFYHGRENLHIGVLYPSYFSNNQSVFQLTVLLGAQKKPQYIGNRKNKFEIENEYIIFTQIMNELLISDVYNELCTKYGHEKFSTKDTNDVFTKIDDFEFKTYRQSPKNKHQQFVYEKQLGTTYHWETDIMEISFFTGFLTDEILFMEEFKDYTVVWLSDINDIPNDSYLCRRFPYLKYKLKSHVIKNLGLDKSNL